MSIFKTEDCPICGNKTNAFQKTMARYNGKFICRRCYPKIIKSGVNVGEIKNKTLVELQQIVGYDKAHIDSQPNIATTSTLLTKSKKFNNDIAAQIKSGQSYYLEDTQTAIDFYENYLEYTEKQYSSTKWKIGYDTEKLYAFQLKEITYEAKDYYHAVHIHYYPYSGAIVSKMLIVHFDKNRIKEIQKLIQYLESKIAVKQNYDKVQKAQKELEEFERVHGKHRYSKSQFAFLDDDYYLKYSYYDVAVKGVEYFEFDISEVKIEEALNFEFEPDNVHDQNAIKVLYHNTCIGYIPKNNLQKMMKDYYEDAHGEVKGFIYRVDEDAKAIYIGLGFYKELTDEELKKIPHMDTTLTKTSKKDDFGTSRQEHLETVSEGDEIDLAYEYETETYIVTDAYANELGEISVGNSQKLQQLEDEGKSFYGIILEIGYNNAGKTTCKIRIFIKEE